MPRQSVIRDTSPLLLRLGTRRLTDGANPVTSFLVDGKRFRLAAMARRGRIVDWAIIGPNGPAFAAALGKVSL